MAIPNFEDGVLPTGDYEVTFEELRHSVLVNGCGDLREQNGWDKNWRNKLVDNLEILVGQLWKVGIQNIFIDGSFVEDKDHPNDIDGYFECDLKYLASRQLHKDLNLIDPHKVWTWDKNTRRPYPGYNKKQLPMWHEYRIDMYPQPLGLKLPTGIKDKHGNDLPFSSAFRLSRTNDKPKGIVKIIQPQGGQK